MRKYVFLVNVKKKLSKTVGGLGQKKLKGARPMELILQFLYLIHTLRQARDYLAALLVSTRPEVVRDANRYTVVMRRPSPFQLGPI